MNTWLTKIKESLPWNKLYKKLVSLQEEVDMLKRTLEKGRFANFIWIIDYTKGMVLNIEGPPPPISLVDLDNRLKSLEERGSE